MSHRLSPTLVLGAILALGGCGEGGDDAAPSVDAVSDAPAAESNSPANDADAPNTGGTGSNLSANTSSLTANTSDLNSRIVGTDRIVELPADVLFDFDSAELKPDAEAAMRQVAEIIRGAPAGAITIVGHTDSKGDDAYNEALSLRRAQAVRDWMGEQVGVRQRNFSVEGAGESEPIVSNTNSDGSDSEQGRARNRRVEVVIPLE